jgi:uncharacterized protein YndB with AHSA1/START domain
MSSVTRVVSATPEQVWDVLADGWLYPLWVVGASRMREVDDGWPTEGAELHHSVGAWPVLVDDTTTVTECRPGAFLALRARAWPGGEAWVRLHLEARGAETTVTIEEDVYSGPAALVPGPVRRPLIRWRNVETLRRLAYLAERRQA